MGKSDGFFETGLKTYLDAKTAVRVFEEETQRRVRKAVVMHQPEFSEVLGDNSSLKNYYDASQMPEHMYLGQRVPFKGSGVLYFYLDFYREEGGDSGVVPAISFWRERVAILTPLWDSINARQRQFPNPNLGIRNLHFWLTVEQPPTDGKSCQEALDSLIAAWVEFWMTLDCVPTVVPE